MCNNTRKLRFTSDFILNLKLNKLTTVWFSFNECRFYIVRILQIRLQRRFLLNILRYKLLQNGLSFICKNISKWRFFGLFETERFWWTCCLQSIDLPLTSRALVFELGCAKIQFVSSNFYLTWHVLLKLGSNYWRLILHVPI